MSSEVTSTTENSTIEAVSLLKEIYVFKIDKCFINMQYVTQSLAYNMNFL